MNKVRMLGQLHHQPDKAVRKYSQKGKYIAIKYHNTPDDDMSYAEDRPV